MRALHFVSTPLGILGLTLLPAISTASPIFGSLQSSQGAITLSPLGIGFSTTAVPTGSFAGLGATSATVSDVGFMLQPLNTPFLLTNFVTFAANPGVRVDLTSINLGSSGQAQCVAAPAAGQTCTPAFASLVSPPNPLGLAPYNFQNTQTGSTASWTVGGLVRDAVGNTTAVTGVYTMQFGQPYQAVLAQMASGGSPEGSYSAQFTSSAGNFAVGAAATISLAGIDFQSNPIVGSLSAGTFRVESGSAGTFASLLGTTGQASDLTFLLQPPNFVFLDQNFLTFAADPTVVFDLTSLRLGLFGQAQCSAAPALGQLCTPAFAGLVSPPDPLGLSPFNFANTVGGSTVSISFGGQMRRISTGELSPYTGVITAQFGSPYQAVLAMMTTGAGVTGEYSATLTTTVTEVPVPEPATVFLLGPALVTFCIRRRRALQ